jgi:hypothetical protein
MKDFQLESVKLLAKGGMKVNFKVAVEDGEDFIKHSVKIPLALNQKLITAIDDLNLHLLRLNFTCGFGIFASDLGKADKKIQDAVKKIQESIEVQELKLGYSKDNQLETLQIVGEMMSFLPQKTVRVETPKINLTTQEYGEHGVSLMGALVEIQALVKEYTTEKVFVQLELF